MTDYMRTWTREGIIRPDLVGFSVSDDIPEDDYLPRRDLSVDSAFELTGGVFGLALRGVGNLFPDRLFFVELSEVSLEDEQVGYVVNEVESLELDEDAVDLIQRLAGFVAGRVSRELHSAEMGYRRTDILSNTQCREGMPEFCELMDIWELPGGTVTMRFSLGEGWHQQFCLTVDYNFEEGGTWQSHTIEQLGEGRFNELEKYVGNVGWFLRKEDSFLQRSTIRPEFIGDILDSESGVPCGISISLAGSSDDGTLWIFLSFLDVRERRCRIWGEMRDIVDNGETNYALELHQDTTILRDGLELHPLDLFGHIFRARQYQDAVRAEWRYREDLAGVSESTQITNWGNDGMPQDLTVTLTVTEVREGPENRFFMVMRQEGGNALPRELICEAVLHRSPRDKYQQGFTIPLALSQRDPVIPLIKRALTLVHCRLYRGSERESATRRGEFESLKLSVPIPETEGRNINLSTTQCWQFGPREFDVMVELDDGNGSSMMTIATFHTFERTETGYSFRVSTVGIESIEGENVAFQALGLKLASDIDSQESSG